MGGGKCAEKSDEPTNSNKLGMSHVGGVFLVLMLGCVISTLIAIVEFLWNIRKVAVQEKVIRKIFYKY
jgi:ionotropic glutamate receptor